MVKKCSDVLKFTLNSGASNGYEDTTASGNGCSGTGGFFKKSPDSSFTQTSHNDFVMTKNSYENEKENNQTLMNKQLLSNATESYGGILSE